MEILTVVGTAIAALFAFLTWRQNSEAKKAKFTVRETHRLDPKTLESGHGYTYAADIWNTGEADARRTSISAWVNGAQVLENEQWTDPWQSKASDRVSIVIPESVLPKTLAPSQIKYLIAFDDGRRLSQSKSICFLIRNDLSSIQVFCGFKAWETSLNNVRRGWEQLARNNPENS